MDKTKVRYIGASDDQVHWGNCDDPRGTLALWCVYEVSEQEVHSWHTKLSLVGFEGKFNSVSFEAVPREEKTFGAGQLSMHADDIHS